MLLTSFLFPFTLLTLVNNYLRYIDSAESSSQQSPLSKWFNVDAIKKTPPAPDQDPAAKGKVITVEDLERSQK